MCIGILPPSFVEYALRAGADGVLITGCRDGDCEYRFGNRWTEERLAAAREPHLRRSIEKERVDIFWAGPTDGAALVTELRRFRSALAALPARVAVAPPKRRDVTHG
jgi:coenzyme F420-reducing hydrogenase delta subunit